MKINFNTEYKVFKNHTVKCTLECVLTDCNEILHMPIVRRCVINFDETNDRTTLSFIVSAVAKCDPIDDFNLETGKRIAESRANIKALKVVSDLIQESRNIVSKINTKLAEDFNKTEFILAREKSHLDILIENA